MIHQMEIWAWQHPSPVRVIDLLPYELNVALQVSIDWNWPKWK